MQSKKSFFKNVSLFWFLTIIICLGLFFSLPVLAKVVEFYDTTSIKLNVRAGSQQLTVPLQTWSDNENNILTIMNSSGHIGIGTTEIGTDSLRVQGDGYISGNLNIGNSIKVEGVSGANINCGEDLVLGEPLIDGGVVIGGTCQSITEAGGVGGTGTENFIPKWNVHGTGLVDTNIIYESNDYNVGIGTTTPGIYKLNVWGKISADSENLYTDGLGNLTAQSFYDKGNATKYLDPSKTDGYGLVIADSISIEGTARANYFAGNVGIGTTGPGKRLEVKENIGAEMGIRISNNAGGALQTLEFHDTVNPKAKIQSSNVGADLRFFTGSGASNIEQMRILSSGNVGIGTTGPSEKLVVGDDIGNITSYTGISVGDSNYAGVFMGSDINNHGKIQYSVGSGYLIFGTKSNSVDYLGTMYLKDGNVGIGTTSPGVKLDVNGGNVRTTNQLVSTVATGTAPLAVSSTTLVSNLNAELLNGQNGSYYRNANNINAGTLAVARGGTGRTSHTAYMPIVGGITTTAAQQSVGMGAAVGQALLFKGLNVIPAFGAINLASGSSIVTGTLPIGNGGTGATSYGANRIIFMNSGNTAFTSDANFVYSSGNVGIGTTTPGAKLEVASPSSGVALKVGRVSGQPSIQGTSDWFIIDNAGSEPLALNYWSPNNVLLVQGGGNVGIGTTAPSQQIDMTGDLTIGGGDLYFSSSDDTGKRIQTSDTFNILNNTSAWGARMNSLQVSSSYSGTAPTNGILFYTDANLYRSAANQLRTNDSLIIDGNVGIGTTNPSQKLDVNGTTLATRYYIDSTSNYIDTTGSYLTLQSGGNEIVIGGGATTHINYRAAPSGTVTSWVWNAGSSSTYASHTMGALNLHGDVNITKDLIVAGKIYANEIDPVYEIDNVKYATYGHFTTGLNEETTGKLRLQIPNFKIQIPNKFQNPNSNEQIYTAVIDFSKQEIGSDLWLFRQVTAFGHDWQDLVVSLTPEGRAEVWYELDEKENTLTIFGTQPVAVSYRLIAPRFDWPERDTNLATNQEAQGIKVSR